MCSFACQIPIVKDKDQICLLDTGRTLGYQECGCVPVKSVERFTQRSVCCKVKCAGAVIQDQDFRFLYQCTGNRESLFLTAGEILSVLFQLKIKLSWFPLYHFFSLGGSKCLPEIFVCGIFTSPFHVVTDRAFEEGCFLRNNTDSGTEVISFIVLDFMTI